MQAGGGASRPWLMPVFTCLCIGIQLQLPELPGRAWHRWTLGACARTRTRSADTLIHEKLVNVTYDWLTLSVQDTSIPRSMGRVTVTVTSLPP
eukprot:scaffold19230_cov129-Isochrysis_galbana.AAC.4